MQQVPALINDSDGDSPLVLEGFCFCGGSNCLDVCEFKK
jgi:hypothetical protein